MRMDALSLHANVLRERAGLSFKVVVNSFISLMPYDCLSIEEGCIMVPKYHPSLTGLLEPKKILLRK